MAVALKAKRAGTSAELGSSVTDVVAELIADVRRNGEEAVRRLSERFDNWSPSSFRLSEEEIDEALQRVPKSVLEDIRTAQHNVRRFAEHQKASLEAFEIEMERGVRLGQRHIPIDSVGAYVPGGRYPLVASAHMTIVTARAAGVRVVRACTPPARSEVPDATVAAMYLAGADEIHILGGVQAIAAMALGTESIAKVDFIVGPGNAYVAEAKRQLFGDVGIDLIAGPTEIVVLADDSADPFVVAVDLLSQAEHGPDSPAILITTDEALGREVMKLIDHLLPGMPTKAMAEPAWRDHGEVLLAADEEEVFRVANCIASEHVEVMMREPRTALERLTNYGSLFLGERTCVSYGDKVIGTNHILPTGKAAKYTGGLWVGRFLRTVTYQEVTDDRASGELGELCARASRVENFEGHARSGDLRAARVSGVLPDWAKPVVSGLKS